MLDDRKWHKFQGCCHCTTETFDQPMKRTISSAGELVRLAGGSHDLKRKKLESCSKLPPKNCPHAPSHKKRMPASQGMKTDLAETEKKNKTLGGWECGLGTIQRHMAPRYFEWYRGSLSMDTMHLRYNWIGRRAQQSQGIPSVEYIMKTDGQCIYIPFVRL